MIQSTRQWFKLPYIDVCSLLNCNYEACMKKLCKNICEDVNIFGLTIYGDGAMINKRPMINFIGVSVYDPQCLLDVVDCTNHMADGIIKNAWNLASQCTSVMAKLRKDGKLYDMATFDESSNIQRGGMWLVLNFPTSWSSMEQSMQHPS